MNRTWKIGPAAVEDLEAALQLAMRHLPANERRSRLANALALLLHGELDPAGILVAREGADLRGVIVSASLPGAGGLMWPPQVLAGSDSAEIARELVRLGCSWLHRKGAKLVEALLETGEMALAAPLVDRGFQHLTGLQYLHCELSNLDLSLLIKKSDDCPLTFASWSTATAEAFRATILRTYEGTLDCPELEGTRTLPEILAGHKAQGCHDPELWWLVYRENQPVGVVLLTRMPEWDAWDLVYLGVVPEARRQGLGTALTKELLRRAEAAAMPRVTLAVDSRNLPAVRMYMRFGFVEFDRKEVFLHILSSHPPA